MGRAPNSPAPMTLPKVSFERIQDELSSYPIGVHDQQARSYGYNDFSSFKRPEHYIRYIEPLESELAEQVEYDMDEQDQEWLDAVNSERKKQHQDSVSYEVFEIVMDRLEKEWFDLTKNIPKPDIALPSEDSTCAICDDSEGENANAIVFCDGCNLAVHQDCYGVPYIPEGQWLCRKCTVSPENPVSCVLCPNEGGAFKQTVHGDWVHLLCAIWVPETRVANDVFMEPITGIERIPKQRWRLKCSVCEIKEGACIQCTKSSCFLAFHATCARKEKLLMPMKASQGSEAPTLASYCEKHLPKEQYDARMAALASEHADGETSEDKDTARSSKTARAYAKTYKPGPPLVPHIIVERILQYIGKVNIRQKREFVLLLCKYWSLKREARRGAAFLKRLHLEPWTASSGNRQQTDEEKAIKLRYMKSLRKDLESVRMIAEMCRKRESHKLDRAETVQYVFDKFLFSHEPPLRMAFERIMGADRNEYFKNPVSKVDVPDYYDIIKHPMSWSIIDQKLDKHEYLDLQAFKASDDINLVITNAITYNKSGTPFHRAAQKLQALAEPIMGELDKIAARRSVADESMEGAQERQTSVIGDLEPPLELLELLVSEAAIRNDTELILDKDPLSSLLSYELPNIRPQLPPPPPKPKRDRKADLERKRLERQLDVRGPRTRRGKAMLAQQEGGETHNDGILPESLPFEEMPLAGPSSSVTTSGEPSASKSRKRWRRSAPEQPGHVNAPRVEAVDSHQSFQLFDKGWILPENQKRRGRPSLPHPPAPPIKKSRSGRKSQAPLDAGGTDPSQASNSPSQPSIESSAFQATWLPGASMQSAAGVEMAVTRAQTTAEIEALSAEALMQLATAEPPIMHPARAPEPPAASPIHTPKSSSVRVDESAAVVLAQIPDIPVSDLHASPSPGLTSRLTPDLTSLAQPEIHGDYDEHPVDEMQVDPEDQHAIESSAENTESSPAYLGVRSTPEARIAVPEVSAGSSIADTATQPLEPPAGLAPSPMEASALSAEPPAASSEGLSAPLVEAMEVDGPALAQVASEQVEQAVARKTPAKGRRPQAPRNVIIIEELDTPATRREKNRLKTARARRLREEAAKVALLQLAAQAPADAGDGPSEEPAVAADKGSDLSSLSDLSDHEGDQPAVESRLRPRSVAGSEGAESQSWNRVPGYLEGGTLVWAKAATFPWWPAVIFETDDSGVPPRVLEQYHETADRNIGPLHIIRFFDNQNSWQLLRPDKFMMLGEDMKLDESLLAGSSKLQKWKTAKIRNQCRAAYRRAMAEMETDGEIEPEAGSSAHPLDAAASVPSTQRDAGLPAESPFTEVDMS
ncbi:hypothetical protein WOLCODRAFT_134245 [Wolfiporia cocos MD-104 SS10]|uniref:Bromodomain-containing protein n=1 Tax=Wolfiporia cocos (strain MD-104) TaxID=742152 RepID=A0A2H3JID5_WOLCO|nr:hypothetical protein WOLCODRAFT_134245 [Wolfiporia cocos MD-104 SS10]